MKTSKSKLIRNVEHQSEMRSLDQKCRTLKRNAFLMKDPYYCIILYISDHSSCLHFCLLFNCSDTFVVQIYEQISNFLIIVIAQIYYYSFTLRIRIVPQIYINF